MRRTGFVAFLTASILSLLLPAASHADVSRAEILASTCFACHGTDGKSPSEIPSIQGHPPEELFKMMKAFQDGSRPATVMDRHAKGYTDEEIKLIAGYLSNIRQ